MRFSSPGIVRSLILVASCFVLCAGCRSNLTAKRMAARNPLAKNAAKSPVSMVDVWQTYAETGTDGKAQRGVGGRIHFYAEGKKKEAIKVDGDVTVFVFDGEEKDPAHAKPLKIYQFKAETLTKHYASKKPLGHGYDFFLPFDELGGEEKTLCIMTRFDDRLEGGLILSQPVNTILKGTKRHSTVESPFQEFLASRSNSDRRPATGSQPGPMDPNDITQVAFRQGNPETAAETATPASGGPSNPAEQRTVATILLNDPMTRRLSQPVSDSASSSTPTPESDRRIAESTPPSDASAPVAPAAWNRASDRLQWSKAEKIDYPKTNRRELGTVMK